jgi:DDE superfamily endonuclease
MLVCDFDYRFTYVMTGWEGSASDATVLKSAFDNRFSVPRCKYYLVDAGYANTPQFIAPYRGVRYHVREQRAANEWPWNYKELFNLRHAQLRNHIEKLIEIVKMRLPILKVATYHTVDTQTDIVHAACILHNLIVYHNGDANWNMSANSKIDPNDIVDVPDGDEEYGEDVEGLNN